MGAKIAFSHAEIKAMAELVDLAVDGGLIDAMDEGDAAVIERIQRKLKRYLPDTAPDPESIYGSATMRQSIEEERK